MIVPYSQLASLIRRWKRKRKQVGLVTGTFDLVHPGHLFFLAEARKHCTVLVVALENDASVRKAKGPKRPIMRARHRAMLLDALKLVDIVSILPERASEATLEKLKPDRYIITVFDAYRAAKLKGARAAKVKLIEITRRFPYHSTTRTIRRILAQHS